MPLPPEYTETVFLLEDAPVPLPVEFAIITAWNPMWIIVPASVNRRADGTLAGELEQRGISCFRATGCSPDLTHREPGWAIAVTAQAALELGRRFKQLAIWRVRGDELVLVDCADGDEHVVGFFTPRIIPTTP